MENDPKTWTDVGYAFVTIVLPMLIVYYFIFRN